MSFPDLSTLPYQNKQGYSNILFTYGGNIKILSNIIKNMLNINIVFWF